MKAIVFDPIDRHHYDAFTVSLCVELYVCGNGGFRTAVKLLNYLNEKLHLGLASIPSRNTIENWVLKSGYSLYKETQYEGDYALIVDESMFLGGEKMFLSLGVGAVKESTEALKKKDVQVLDISVRAKWNAEVIQTVLSSTEEQMGKKSSYVISDNDSKLSKAIQDHGAIHIRDVGHTLALLVERIYNKEKDFIAFSKAMGSSKQREAMRATSYLLPPRQRSIARFMNLSPSIQWSKRMQKAFGTFTGEEQYTFGFVNKYKKVIQELDCIFVCINAVSGLIKREGLSHKTIDKSLKHLEKTLKLKSVRVKKFKASIEVYLKEEKDKLPDKKSVWNASSDIIESIFGTYKSRKSKNPLHGITSFVLLLPLLTHLEEGKADSTVNFKHTLEHVYMKDLKQWRQMNLTENMAVKRTLKLAG